MRQRAAGREDRADGPQRAGQDDACSSRLLVGDKAMEKEMRGELHDPAFANRRRQQ